MNVLAFDIGGTFIKYALMDENAKIFTNGKCSTPQSGREELLNTLTTIYKTYPEAEGIAISMPGIIDTRNGYCVMGGALRYNDDFRLKDALYETCKTKIVMENDAKCAAMAEASLGALKDVEDGMVIILGTMIGGGLIHNKKLLRGVHFSAGEVSYIRTARKEMPHHNEFWGNQCGVPELCRLYAERINELPENVDGQRVFAAYHEGSPEAREALTAYAGNIALQLFSLQTVFDPERIAIGGGVSAQDVLLDHIREELQKLYDTCPYIIPKAQIVRCTFCNNANLIGAVQCFVNEA